MLEDGLTYAGQVLGNWYVNIATGLFTILAIAGALLKGPRLATRGPFWAAVFMLLVAAPFQAWRGERTRAAARVPELTVDKEERMRAVLVQAKGASVNVSVAAGNRQVAEFGDRIINVFRVAGWAGSGGGSVDHPSPGTGSAAIKIITDEPNAKDVGVAQRGLEAAGLSYRMVRVCDGTHLSIEIGERLP